ncbi:transglutaminase-like domain-containing protein [Dinghuibacter silviterrae]|uniref:Transglutaminase superfamily protein n=1 Tax=Dinghuibacter silviterrae TaxID=1539049 RepID=A0A4R8DH53_9BACT|nr:transglutaminase-like domain-containing protein [Dinghuibacter silviterrae]TDW96855.1 transglutaminase superfamily protein [Dinghuibacter silviterrae]
MTFLLLLAWLHTADTSFARFADHQNDLFVKAYEARDTVRYNSLLSEFIKRYDQLDSFDQRNYRGYLENAFYNLSCTFALLNSKDRALLYLDKSIQAGYLDYMHMSTDSDLTGLHDETRFKTLMAFVRTVGDYRYILGRAGAYNTADQRPLPAFTYAPATDPHLQALRTAFNLDSIAGKANDVSQVINLMRWIHNLVPHDGNHGNPDVANALAMIAVCKREHRGLNCRGLATVLNECYLAMGFKSRFVTCLPKDSLHVDNDCHVINMVYIPSLHKWVWMDPTNEAYVMNEQGQLLGLAEVRQRLIDDRPLIVNPDANWNHLSSTLKEDYLYSYMAKNLYILECPVASEYDTEARTTGKTLAYIRLLPLDYFQQGPDKTVHTYPKEQVTFVTYRTNNPEAFWAAP